MTDRNDMFIDDLLAEARAQDHPVPQHLMARVLLDAEAAISAAATPPRQGLWDLLTDVIGGWPALGGLAMAGVAGIWVGYAPPAGLPGIADDLWGDAVSVTVLDLSSDYEEFFDAE